MFAGESDQPEIVRDDIVDICSNFSSDMISKEDFRRIRNALYGDLIRSLDNAESIVNRFVSNRLLSGDIFSQLRAITDIEVEDIVALGRQVLKSDALAMSVIFPNRK